jgi:hypothetical protein
MTSGRSLWWLAGAALGALFVALNVVNLIAIDGDIARDLVGLALGTIMVAAALARYLGWRGARG